MTDESKDERYDEAAIRKMAALWAEMYRELVNQGVPAELATKIVCTWIKTTLVKS